MSRLRERKWQCKECKKHHLESELLKAANPFDAEQVVWGCTECKCVDCFDEICDEPECKQPASCGFPEKEDYRRTCYQHSEFVKVK